MKVVAIIWLICLIACYPLGMNAAEKITEIHLISEEWEGATNEDGTGLYWDLFRLIYEPVGIQVHVGTFPYIRTVRLIQAQQADAQVGSYNGEIEGVLYPRYHFDVDRVVAVFLKEKPVEWEGEQTLNGKLVGWIRGYDYDQYLESVVQKYEVNNRASGLKMLLYDRLDFFLDALTDVEDELNKEYLKDHAEKFRIERTLNLKLYLAFANNERGKTLMNIFDERMEFLLATGQIEQLFETSGYTPYPGDTWNGRKVKASTAYAACFAADASGSECPKTVLIE